MVENINKIKHNTFIIKDIILLAVAFRHPMNKYALNQNQWFISFWFHQSTIKMHHVIYANAFIHMSMDKEPSKIKWKKTKKKHSKLAVLRWKFWWKISLKSLCSYCTRFLSSGIQTCLTFFFFFFNRVTKGDCIRG